MSRGPKERWLKCWRPASLPWKQHPHHSNAVPNTRNARKGPGSDQQTYFSSSTTKQNKLGAGTALTGLPVKTIFSSRDRILGDSNGRHPLQFLTCLFRRVSELSGLVLSQCISQKKFPSLRIMKVGTMSYASEKNKLAFLSGNDS